LLIHTQSFYGKFDLKENQMNYFGKNSPPQGESKNHYVLVGVLITLTVLLAAKYFNDHDNDVRIHPPVINVH
jgi:hypothetical protein